MKRVLNLVFASFASACINEDFSAQLNGQETLAIDSIFTKYLEEGTSLVDLNEPGRYEIFGNKLIEIVAHNSDETNTWKKGVNRHTAMTHEEVLHYYKMDVQAEQNCSATKEKTESVPINDDMPPSYDWRDHNGVSPVKDQGNCGSCWTFSTVGCLESAHLIKYGELQTFSEQ